jgi:hypothetical protein
VLIAIILQGKSSTVGCALQHEASELRSCYQSLEYSELVRMSIQELPDQGTDDAVSESRGNAE